jgi:hypothetical protein
MCDSIARVRFRLSTRGLVWLLHLQTGRYPAFRRQLSQRDLVAQFRLIERSHAMAANSCLIEVEPWPGA